MIQSLNFNSSVPLYKQLSDIIRDSIEYGEYDRDSQIPTEQELSDKYGVSRITVRKALNDLVEDEILVRRQGKGTFVASRNVIKNSYPFMSFQDSCNAAGQTASTKLIRYSLEKPTKKQNAFFNLSENERVIQIIRLRSANQIPVILETDYFPESFDFLMKEPLNESTGTILGRHHIFATHGESTIKICEPTPEERSYFNASLDAPLLYVYSTIYDQNHNPIEISKQLIRSDLYHLILEY